MDFNTFKNVAFASFIFAPVLVFALMLIALLFIGSQFKSNKINYSKIIKLSFKALLYQLCFIIVVGVVFGGLFLTQQIRGIPVILLLPLSTIIAFIAFIRLYWRARGEIHT